MKLSENRISSTFYLLLTTLIILSFTHLIPKSFFAANNLKKVDYIEPLVLKEKLATKFKKKKQVVQTKAVKKDSIVPIPVPEGLVTLEDYSADGSQMKHLMQALYNSKSSTENVRIAFYGDSFIEGDIVTMDLRDSLQKKFGGDGIGYLPMTSDVPKFRKTMPCETSGWKVYSIANRSKKQAFGIAGTAFVADNQAELKLFAPKPMKSVQLLYRNMGDDAILESTYNKNTTVDTLTHSEDLSAFDLTDGNSNIYKYQLKVTGKDDLKLYGVNIANGKGVYLDNFSIRGNSGLGLKEIADSQYVAFQKLLNYKLVIFQFGLNAAPPDATDFSIYERQMTKMILHMKALFPETSFMILSISDRSHNENGSFVTMPSIPYLVDAQQRIAQESGILFWNMYEAMGGENSMVKLVNEKKANKDYTHLTFSGGKFVADKLYKALMFEYKKYEKKENDKVRLAVR